MPQRPLIWPMVATMVTVVVAIGGGAVSYGTLKTTASANRITIAQHSGSYYGHQGAQDKIHELSTKEAVIGTKLETIEKNTEKNTRQIEELKKTTEDGFKSLERLIREQQ